MAKSRPVFACLAALTALQGYPQSIDLPWNYGVGTIDAACSEAVLLWSPRGELLCVAVADGRLAAWKASGGSGSPFQPAPVDPSVGEFSGCRALTVHRRQASDWLVFFTGTRDGREGLHALGFDGEGNLSPLFRDGFDRDSMMGPVGAFEIRWTDWDAFEVFYVKGEELGVSRVERGNRTVSRETVSPPGMHVYGFSLQSVPDGTGVAFLGSAEARNGSGIRGVLLFEVRGAYPATCEFLAASLQSAPMTARIFADRNGDASCVLQNGPDARVIRRVPGGWMEGVSASIPLDRYSFFPLQPPMKEGAFVLSTETDWETLYAAIQDALQVLRLHRITTPGIPGSVRLVPLDPGTLLIGWNRTMPEPGFSACLYETASGEARPLSVPIPDGHRFLDAALIPGRDGSPTAVLLTEDGGKAWILRCRYGATEGRFTVSDRRSLPLEGASVIPPIGGCAFVGDAFVLFGASGLILLDERSDAAAVFPGRGRLFRCTDGSAQILLNNSGTLSVLRLAGSEE